MSGLFLFNEADVVFYVIITAVKYIRYSLGCMCRFWVEYF
ncbi:hypothetical protein HMPREF0454_01350 [Hafnia alvei ATCC 51873]|uniref:Uncharacterized protein n=1 Tax=Hafnia alvei ATCC 51873 TaxID=1002364 RepID=G9Y486_HAFAL|nr:hypothetical protein HMPREF0454_01350 [Hafnia alvei ATCC 51873]